MNYGWNVIIRYDEVFDSLNVWIVNRRQDHELEVVVPLNLGITTIAKPNIELPQPTLKLARLEARQFLQGLSDGLAQAGFIPDAVKESKSELTATKYHLEDMRKLVFKEKENKDGSP